MPLNHSPSKLVCNIVRSSPYTLVLPLSKSNPDASPLNLKVAKIPDLTEDPVLTVENKNLLLSATSPPVDIYPDIPVRVDGNISIFSLLNNNTISAPLTWVVAEKIIPILSGEENLRLKFA